MAEVSDKARKTVDRSKRPRTNAATKEHGKWARTLEVDEREERLIWGFNGSSTNQAPGEQSDCVLQPVFSCPDPIRGRDNMLVLCEVLNTDMTPHPSNTRAACVEVARKY